MKKPKPGRSPGPVHAHVPAQPGHNKGAGKGAGKKKPVHVSAATKRARHKAAMAAAKTRAANAKKAKHHPKRQLALGEGVACCSAEALAASARLAGYQVSDADVLALYWRTAGDPDEGASILATLEAAQRFGLVGVRPVSFAPAVDVFEQGQPFPRGGLHLGCPEGVWDDGDFHRAPVDLCRVQVHAGQRSQIVIGVTLPGGPHALALDPSGAVWSWGELYRPTGPGLIEEAWLVDWGS